MCIYICVCVCACVCVYVHVHACAWKQCRQPNLLGVCNRKFCHIVWRLVVSERTRNVTAVFVTSWGHLFLLHTGKEPTIMAAPTGAQLWSSKVLLFITVDQTAAGSLPMELSTFPGHLLSSAQAPITMVRDTSTRKYEFGVTRLIIGFWCPVNCTGSFQTGMEVGRERFRKMVLKEEWSAVKNQAGSQLQQSYRSLFILWPP